MLATLRHSLRNLSEQRKLLFLSLVVGCVSGLAAVVLRAIVNLVKRLLNSGFNDSANWQYLVLPGLGMLVSLLILRFFVRDDISHGVTKVLYAVSRNESKIKPHNMWSSILTSAVTIGFGGSVGAEAPIVYTGAAIGSNFARYMGLTYKNMTVLLGCGAAGAIAGIFKAPLAGVIFTMEVLLFNISMASMLPLLLSTVSATVIAYAFTGQGAMFSCSLIPFSMVNIPFYLVLGVVCGFGSLYFMRMTLWMEDRFGKVGNLYLKWAFCALGIGMLIFLFPALYGEGYDFIQNLLDAPDFDTSFSWGVPLLLLMIFLAKVLAMAMTNAGGGVGGTFGPTLFEGAILGFLVARSFNLIFSDMAFSVPEQNFTLVGMAALMAGVMQAPMTAIFLIAEITGGYELLFPVILTSAISFGIARIFEKYSIYSKRIAQNGDLLTHDSDKSVITLLNTRDLIRDKYPRVSIDASLRDIAQTISNSDAAVFPVLDSEKRFQGIIDMDHARKYMFRENEYDSLYVRNIMEQPLAYVYEDEKMESVLEKFEKTQAWRLPVIKQDMTYVGFVSKSRILLAYRSELQKITNE